MDPAAVPRRAALLAGSRYELLVKIATGGTSTVYVGRISGSVGFSLLVAIIKIKDLGDLEVGLGLYAFIALLVLMTLAQSQFDSHECWDRLEQQGQ